MGIRKYRGRIVCDKRWPDGSRTTRVCANRTQAKDLLARITASVADGTWRKFKEKLKLRDRGSISLQEFSVTYMENFVKVRNKNRTYKRKEVSLKPLNQSMGRLHLEAITPSHLHNYVRWRKNQGVSNATTNRDITTIKHLLNYAVECGVIESNLVGKFKNLREERKERPRFTEEQIQKVIDTVRPGCRPLFVFIRETGCRSEEAMSLQRWQIQEGSMLVVFSEDTKSWKFRYVPLTEAALEAVNALPPIEGCPYVFYKTKTKDRWYGCRKAWEKARKEAGLVDVQVKDLRRHYAIDLAENGADMHDIQQVLGHSTVATTERHYAQFSPKHSAKKILKVLEGGKSRKKKRTA
ncbi:tyrosine-type recombinase/integrase [Acidobacteria bacterium AH-259-D05]|nr:tyrosine-type recombinase/integrase [Acidobacteria bacterium AH-259-D05]